MTALTLRLQNIAAAYGAQLVLEDVTLDVRAGELVALLGRSGCGKTTLLKIVAGLLPPTRGEVFFGQENFTHVPAARRGVGVVFQKPLLFPYLNVFDNIAFGLKMRGIAKSETRMRVAEALHAVQLEGYESRRAAELSGGQEQRIALARALVTRPRVLLLDEPFSALDASLRIEMRSLVSRLQRELHITTLFVTHDQHEAATLAARIAFLDDGRLLQTGAPRDLYLTPATPAVAHFFGWLVIEGKLCATQSVTDNGIRCDTALGRLTGTPRSPLANHKDESVWLAIHPAQVRIVTAPERSLTDDATENLLPATIEAVVDFGARVTYTVRLRSNDLLTIDLSRDAHHEARTTFDMDENICVSLPREAVLIFHK
ncbi:MAG: ABC transporter ATP-binding protein [Pyrinomonadaceae bacterium MAG19_C2-C3]|nr:ABC transporter ATP-binding protein [Pyrinomonadaceae bacterium MAG19_C2-C3]